MQFFGPHKNALEAAKIRKGFPWWLIVIFAFSTLPIYYISIFGIAAFTCIALKLTGFGYAYDELMASPLLDDIGLYFTLFDIIATLIFARVIDKIRLKQLGLKKEKFAVRYLVGLIAGFAMFSASVFMAKLLGAVEFSASPDAELAYILIMIPGWIIQGFSEEFLCRGFVMTAIAKRYSTFWGVFINSAVFAAMHSFNTGLTPLALFNLFLFGIFASIVFLISENIWFVAAVHSVWNFTQGNFYGIPVSGNAVNPATTFFLTSFVPGKDLFNGGSFGIEGGICDTVIHIIAIVIAYIIYRKKHPELK